MLWESSDQRIRLYRGDCTEIVPTLEDGSINAIVTSPPYNQLATMPKKGTGLWAKSDGGAGFLRKWSESGYQDDMAEPDYQAWQNYLFSVFHLKAARDASLFYNHQLRWRGGVCLHPVEWFRPEGWRLRSEIIWDRAGGMMLNARMFCRFDERILWHVAGKKWKWNQSAVGYGTIWRIARQQQQQGKNHPVAFPLEIPARCLEAATDADDLVADPFMGGGTVGVACARMGRRFIGIERDQEHFDSAVNAIKDALGMEVPNESGTIQKRLFPTADARQQ